MNSFRSLVQSAWWEFSISINQEQPMLRCMLRSQNEFQQTFPAKCIPNVVSSDEVWVSLRSELRRFDFQTSLQSLSPFKDLWNPKPVVPLQTCEACCLSLNLSTPFHLIHCTSHSLHYKRACSHTSAQHAFSNTQVSTYKALNLIFECKMKQDVYSVPVLQDPFFSPIASCHSVLGDLLARLTFCS